MIEYFEAFGNSDVIGSSFVGILPALASEESLRLLQSPQVLEPNSPPN
jgi:hypothetical protein